MSYTPRWLVLFLLICVPSSAYPRMVFSASLGPYVSSPMDSMGKPTSVSQNVVPPPISRNLASFVIDPASLSIVPALLAPTPAIPAITARPDPTFYKQSAYDISAANNGLQIVNVSYGVDSFEIYSMNGSTTYVSETLNSFFCGSNPLPACAETCNPGCIAGDARIYYDSAAARWIITAMWVFDTERPVKTFVAVSQTRNPLGQWNKYQIPQCGPDDTGDGSDQPHMGFNQFWIVINSACLASFNGYSMNVLDKATLYSGGTLCGPNSCGTGNANWWEFQDVVAGDDGRQDNPVATYPKNVTVEYLTHAQIDPNTSLPQVVYSYIGGPEFSPNPQWAVQTVEAAGDTVAPGLATANAPSCSGCISALTFNWIHSSQVHQLPDGNNWLLSSEVWQSPSESNTNIGTFVATNLTTGASEAVNIDHPGTGLLADEITATKKSTGPGVTDPVYIVWALSASNFYPGMQWYVWDLVGQTLNAPKSFQGTLVPPSGSFDAARWLDFITAAGPMPPTRKTRAGSVLLGSPVARPSSTDPYKSILFTNTNIQ